MQRVFAKRRTSTGLQPVPVIKKLTKLNSKKHIKTETTAQKSTARQKQQQNRKSNSSPTIPRLPLRNLQLPSPSITEAPKRTRPRPVPAPILESAGPLVASQAQPQPPDRQIIPPLQDDGVSTRSPEGALDLFVVDVQGLALVGGSGGDGAGLVDQRRDEQAVDTVAVVPLPVQVVVRVGRNHAALLGCAQPLLGLAAAAGSREGGLLGGGGGGGGPLPRSGSRSTSGCGCGCALELAEERRLVEPYDEFQGWVALDFGWEHVLRQPDEGDSVVEPVWEPGSFARVGA